MPSPTVLTFEYVEERAALELSGHLVESWDEKDRLIGRISLFELAKLKRAFRADVQQIQVAYGKKLDLSKYSHYVYEYLEELYLAGRAFWRAVSRDQDTSWLERIGEGLTPPLAGEWWSVPDPGVLAKSIFHIETKGRPESLLPLDALPLGFRDQACIVHDKADVLRLAALFGGFRSIVRHTPLTAGTFLYPPAHGRQVTLYLRDIKADGHEAMPTIMESAATAVIGPFPTRKYYDTPNNIARALLMSEPALGDDPAIPDLVQVHAHAKVGTGISQKLLITFEYGTGDYEHVIVRSSHFEAVDEENTRIRNSGTPVDTGPLVVFNSCEALGYIGEESLSSAIDLATFGTRAVAGPREEVLADYAVKFSRTLHQQLSTGSTIGEAAAAGRWSTLIDYLNPLGLIYATFGDVESRRNLP